MRKRDSRKTPDNKEIYTLLSLLNYARQELGSLDEFAAYFVDMSIFQLSQHLSTSDDQKQSGRESRTES